MKTKSINIFEVQQRWMRWHLSNADTIEYDGASREIRQAIYLPPLYRWRGLYQPDGTLLVPDMDYYNALTDPKEMKDVLDELKL